MDPQMTMAGSRFITQSTQGQHDSCAAKTAALYIRNILEDLVNTMTFNNLDVCVAMSITAIVLTTQDKKKSI